MQQFLKPATGIAGTWIVTPELFGELFVAIDNPLAAHDAGFGREASFTLACSLERKTARTVRVWSSWHTSVMSSTRGRARDYTEPARSSNPAYADAQRNQVSGARRHSRMG